MQRALFGGAGPIYRLPRRIGMLKAKELMLTGKLLTGAEAKDWRLVNDSVPADQLDERVESFVADLADKSPFQMAITKMALNRGLDDDTETLMLVERLAAGVTLNSNDAAEASRRFSRSATPCGPGPSRPDRTGTPEPSPASAVGADDLALQRG